MAVEPETTELLDLKLAPNFPRFTANDSVVEAPFVEFTRLYREALRLDAGSWPGAHNFVLSTVDRETMLPSSRTVSMVTYSDDGFVFCTCGESAKSTELRANEGCAMLFHWVGLHMQVRVRGYAVELSRASTATLYDRNARPERLYYHSCAQAPGSPFNQSTLISDREALKAWGAAVAESFPRDGVLPPLPPSWTSFLIVPVSIEFMSMGSEDPRVRYRLEGGEPSVVNTWVRELLAP
eukprot:a346166_5.p1 GENE.a346166_5~~a346166_5.p1  ORF type:complete len:249 (+),score=70.34 a346166_5:34-747(+)